MTSHYSELQRQAIKYAVRKGRANPRAPLEHALFFLKVLHRDLVVRRYYIKAFQIKQLIDEIQSGVKVYEIALRAGWSRSQLEADGDGTEDKGEKEGPPTTNRGVNSGEDQSDMFDVIFGGR